MFVSHVASPVASTGASPATASRIAGATPANLLAGVSAREAGYYGLAYMEGRIRHCPTLANLRGVLDDGLRDQQIAMLRDAGVLEKHANAYSQADFLNLTRAALAHDTGNCAEMAFVAARAIVEFGYPHPVEVVSFIGQKEHVDRLDHAVVRLHGTTPEDAFWIDPFIRKLAPEEQAAWTGSAFRRGEDHPAAFRQANASAHLFCYVAHDVENRVSLRRASDIDQAFDLSISAKVSRTSSGTIRFQSGKELHAEHNGFPAFTGSHGRRHDAGYP